MKKALVFEDQSSLEILAQMATNMGKTALFLAKRHQMFLLTAFVIIENTYILVTSVG